MATVDYAAKRAKADAMLARFGGPLTIRRTGMSGTAFNPTVTTTDHEATGVVLDYDDEAMANSLIKAGDRKVLIAAGGLDITPDPTTDALVIDGDVLQIVPPVKAIRPRPGGVVVLYECQARA